MSHYDLLIRDYLIEHKYVSFEKMGSLNAGNKASESPHQGSFYFKYDKKAEIDPALIEYIAERTGKSKVLIYSDIESHTESIRQLINIGKPYEIEGVGMLRLAKSGEYEFISYDDVAAKEEHKIVKKQQPPTGFLFVEKKRSNRGILVFLAMIIILGIAGVIAWGTYNLFITKTNIQSNTDTIGSSSLSIPPKPDSITSRVDTASKDTVQVIKNDTADYKFIFETTASRGRAYKRTNQLISYGDDAGFDSLATDDIVYYRLYLKMRLANTDTSRIKDSIELYLQRRIKIVPIN